MSKGQTEYSKMHHTFFTGKTGKAMRGKMASQVVAGYLIYNPHTNMWGVYYLPKSLIAYELGHSEAIIDKALKHLMEIGFCYYDNETEYVFVVEMAHWQVGELRGGDSRISMVNKTYTKMVDNPFLGMFYDRYKDELQLTCERRGHECTIDTRPVDETLTSPLRPCVSVTATVLVPSLSLEVEEQKIVEEVVVVERKFADDPQNLVDLWNQTAPSRYNRVNTVTPQLTSRIKKALKNYPDRKAWEEVIERISLSDFLRDKKWLDLNWVVKVSKGEEIENYAKIMNGNFYDPNSGGMSDLARRNMEAAGRALNLSGIFAAEQSFSQKEIGNGATLEDYHSSTPIEAGDSSWTDAEYRENENLPGPSGDFYGRAGNGSDYVGDEQYE